jgi:AcrR family transcriptional regulator
VHRLLRTEGLERVTFGRLSRETGVSRTTLYRHWSSPSELITAAWALAAPVPVAARTADLERDLVELFLVVRDVVESPAMQRSLPSLLAAARDDPVLSELHAEFVRSRRRPIEARLEQAVADGELAADADVELLVDLLSGSLFYRRLLRREPTSDEDVAATVAAVLAGARPRGGSAG